MHKYEDLSREELEKRTSLASELAIALDGLWFLAVEKSEGFDRALEMDIDVWEKYFSIFIKRLKKYYNLKLNGLEGIKEIIRLDPLWDSIEYEMFDESTGRLVFQVTSCPALDSMLKMNRDELTCHTIEPLAMEKLARVVDPRIKVQALKMPPKESPDDICCKWLFSLDD